MADEAEWRDELAPVETAEATRDEALDETELEGLALDTLEDRMLLWPAFDRVLWANRLLSPMPMLVLNTLAFMFEARGPWRLEATADSRVEPMREGELRPVLSMVDDKVD